MCHAQEAAVEESQKYKEGKYILEKAKIMKVRALLGSSCQLLIALRPRFMLAHVLQEGGW